jgi:hypothetical protein
LVGNREGCVLNRLSQAVLAAENGTGAEMVTVAVAGAEMGAEATGTVVGVVA